MDWCMLMPSASDAAEYVDPNHKDAEGNDVRRTVRGLGGVATVMGCYTENELVDDGFESGSKEIELFVGNPWRVFLLPVAPPPGDVQHKWYFGGFSAKASGAKRHKDYYVRYDTDTKVLDFFSELTTKGKPINTWTPTVQGTAVTLQCALHLG